MPRGLGKSRIKVLEGMFEKIKRLAFNENGICMRHDGIISMFESDLGITYAQAAANIAFLESVGYIERIYSGNKIIGVKLLHDTWEGVRTSKQKEKKAEKKRATDVPIPIEAPVPVPSKVPIAEKKITKEPRYVLFVDWRNIELGASSAERVIQLLIGLEDTLVEQGGAIEAKFVFVPDHRIESAKKLSTLYRYFMVVCPRSTRDQSGKGVWKDTDTVDARISNLGHLVSLFGGSLVTDFVLVSGDRDYMDFARYARNHGKRVTVVAHRAALSDALESAADNVILL